MRNIRSPEEWHSLFDSLFDEQQRSGLNKTQFCRQHGITRFAFSNARYRLLPPVPPTYLVASACTYSYSDGGSLQEVIPMS